MPGKVAGHLCLMLVGKGDVGVTHSRCHGATNPQEASSPGDSAVLVTTPPSLDCTVRGVVWGLGLSSVSMRGRGPQQRG